MIIGKLATPNSVTGKVVQGSGTQDHNALLNRDASDQHPISAITGLETELSHFDSQLARQKQELSNTEITLTTLVNESSRTLCENLSEVNYELATEIQAEHDRATAAEANIAASISKTASLEETQAVLKEVFG